MPTEYFDDTTGCPNCKRWINLSKANDPGPEKCPYCNYQLREKNENPREHKRNLPAQ